MKLPNRGSSGDAMLRGSPLKSVILFGLPIILGNVFQQFYSMVDSIVVGNYVGAGALAAVGSSATIANLIVMTCSGFAGGATIVVSQQYGADRKDEIKTTISTTLIFSLLFSLALMGLGYVLAEPLARITRVPEDIRPQAVTYLRVYSLGLIFLMLYNFFASVLRALGDSVTPLIFLIISSLLNIAGDLFFVRRVGLGVAGVAIATVLAQGLSVVMCIVYVWRTSEFFHFRKGEFIFSRSLFRHILRMGIPSAVQGSVAHLGFIVVQSLVNSFGAVNIAAYTAANKMEGFAMLPTSGISQAFSVYVGQNMGAGDIARTRKGFRDTTLFVSAMSLLSSGVIYVIGPQLIGLFVKAEETEVIARGTAYLRAFCPFLVLHGTMQTTSGLLRGAGDSVFAMLCGFADLGTRMVMAYVLSLGFGLGFMGCAWAIPIGWAATSLLAFVRYRSDKWQTKAAFTADQT